jgi:hypothetical protein
VSVSEEFARWRSNNPDVGGWGLAWFLASEFCTRFYVSHGIRPTVINHEGLGYYGLALEPVRCRVHGDRAATLGRLTMAGDVENWTTGGPGDHGLETIELCKHGAPTDALVEKAIWHMRLPAVPTKSHYACRHHRWGSSYVLSFNIAASLALRHEMGRVSISNAPEEVDRRIAAKDPLSKMKEHPGAFILRHRDRELLLVGDGRVLGDQPRDIWEEYMQGKSAETLVAEIEARIGI